MIRFYFSELGDRGSIKNPELADVNLDAISDDDLSKLFQSEEVIFMLIVGHSWFKKSWSRGNMVDDFISKRDSRNCMITRQLFTEIADKLLY